MGRSSRHKTLWVACGRIMVAIKATINEHAAVRNSSDGSPGDKIRGLVLNGATGTRPSSRTSRARLDLVLPQKPAQLSSRYE